MKFSGVSLIPWIRAKSEDSSFLSHLISGINVFFFFLKFKMWCATFLFPLYLKAWWYHMLNITVGIFLILIAYSETSPKHCFVSDSYVQEQIAS